MDMKNTGKIVKTVLIS